MDLLSHVDWDSYLDGSEVVHDRALPPLTGVGDLLYSTSQAEFEQPVVDTQLVEDAQLVPLIRNLWIVGAVLLLLLFGWSVFFMKRRS